jgi:hypothetical protein
MLTSKETRALKILRFVPKTVNAFNNRYKVSKFSLEGSELRLEWMISFSHFIGPGKN